MHSASFPALLRRSGALMRRAWHPLLPGLAAVTFLSVLMQLVVGERVGQEAALQVRRLLGEQRYEELTQEMGRQVTPADAERFSRRISGEVQETFQSLPPAEQQEFLASSVLQAWRNHWPVLAVFLPLFLLLAAWSRAFFLQLALSPRLDFRALVGRATQTFLPLLGVGAGVTLLSLFWLPAALAPIAMFLLIPPALFPLSLLPALFLAPRFALAPVLYLRREGGIVRSLTESFRRTRGKFMKILGHLLGSAVLSVLVLWLCLRIIDIAALLLAAPAMFLVLYGVRQALSYGAAAYRTVFLGLLSEELLESGGKA